MGQVIIALCLVIRHAVALVLAHKVQLVCIAFDRELTAFFRVGNLDGGGGGKGIADGDLLAGIEVNIALVILKRGALQLCGGAAVRTEINAVFAVFDRAVLNDQLAAIVILIITVLRPCRFARRNGSIAAPALHSGTIDAQCAVFPYLQCRGRAVRIKILVGVGISTAEKVGGGTKHKHIAVGSGDISICDVQRCTFGGAQRRTVFVYLGVRIAGVRAAVDIDHTVVDGVQDPARAGGFHTMEGRVGGILNPKRRAGAIAAVVAAAVDGHIGSICFNSTQDGVHGEIVKRPVAAAQIACGDVVTLHVIGAAVKLCGAREGVCGIEAAGVGAVLCRRLDGDGLPHSVDGHALGSADCNKVRTVFFIPSLIKGHFSGDVDDHIVVLSVDHDPLCIGTAYGINVAIRFNEIIVDDDVAAGQGTGRCHLSGGLCRRIGIFLCAHIAFKFCTSLQSKCAHGKDRGHHAACKYRTDEPCAKLLHKDDSSLVFFVHASFFRLPARFKHLKYSTSATRRNLHSVRTFWIPPPVFSCVL